MDEVYFCPVCGKVTSDELLEIMRREKNVVSVERIYRELERIMILFGKGQTIKKSLED
nr:MAG TPA: zinc ribbon domain protein [Caudoviricetes sp.]